MLARLNIVEGIFSEQVGLLVLATDVRITAPEATLHQHAPGRRCSSRSADTAATPPRCARAAWRT